MALVNETSKLIRNYQMGPRIYMMELESSEIVNTIQPGQFIHVKVPGMEGHILRRPFSVYAKHPEQNMIEIMYQVVGFGTDHMTTLEPGATLELIGPVGHGWNIPEQAQHIMLVAGGVGSAPLFMLTKKANDAGLKIDLVLGAANKDMLTSYDRYAQLENVTLHCATDDGSFGHKGFVTGPVEKLLAENSYDYLACCGPEPMMRAVASMADAANVNYEVSLERRMACGVGACLSCVVDTIHGKKRSCVDGPVFSGEEVLW